jgi:hypothetical protein
MQTAIGTIEHLKNDLNRQLEAEITLRNHPWIRLPAQQEAFRERLAEIDAGLSDATAIHSGLIAQADQAMSKLKNKLRWGTPKGLMCGAQKEPETNWRNWSGSPTPSG